MYIQEFSYIGTLCFFLPLKNFSKILEGDLEVDVESSGNKRAAELVVLMGLAHGGVVGTSGNFSKTPV